MDDDDDYDFEALDRLEAMALAARARQSASTRPANANAPPTSVGPPLHDQQRIFGAPYGPHHGTHPTAGPGNVYVHPPIAAIQRWPAREHQPPGCTERHGPLSSTWHPPPTHQHQGIIHSAPRVGHYSGPAGHGHWNGSGIAPQAPGPPSAPLQHQNSHNGASTAPYPLVPPQKNHDRLCGGQNNSWDPSGPRPQLYGRSHHHVQQHTAPPQAQRRPPGPIPQLQRNQYLSAQVFPYSGPGSNDQSHWRPQQQWGCPPAAQQQGQPPRPPQVDRFQPVSREAGDPRQQDLYSLWGLKPAQGTARPEAQGSKTGCEQQHRGPQAASHGPLTQPGGANASGGQHVEKSFQNHPPPQYENVNCVPGPSCQVPPVLRSCIDDKLSHHTVGVPICEEAASKWVYPLGVPERTYQVSAIATALLSNTLVCLPTGLGKTLIAAVVMHNFTRWFPKGLVVFTAPTRPLVAQQIAACQRFMGLSSTSVAELTGRTKAEERKNIWNDESRRVFFCTPQAFWNDVKRGICPYDTVTCIVVDECHRATGQSDISQTIRFIRRNSKHKFRVLGLCATPGSTHDRVQEIIVNLGISNVYFRCDEDPDVAPYVHNRETEVIAVDAENEGINLRAPLVACLQRVIGHLAAARVYFGAADSERVTRFGLTKAQKAAIQAARAGTGVSPSAQANEWFKQAMVLADLRETLDTYGVSSTLSYLRKKLVEERYIRDLPGKDPVFAHFCTTLEKATVTGGGSARAAKLVDVLQTHFNADGTPGRVIVFVSLREGVKAIIEALKAHEPLICAKAFIGQSGAASGPRSSGPGMKQKEQKEVLKSFESGECNVLVATCIGEEGLDIPQVDLIVCFDATASPTRAVQRQGRTGRHRQGRVVYILSSGREQEQYRGIKETTAQLHSELREAERYFGLAGLGPRMLPCRLTPERIDLELGECVSEDKREDEEDGTTLLARANRRGQGPRGGAHCGQTRKKEVGIPPTAEGKGIKATVENLHRRTRPERRKIGQGEGHVDALLQKPHDYAPKSPPPSQPEPSQFESPGPSRSFIFPNSSSFIRWSSNGRRPSILPPPERTMRRPSDEIVQSTNDIDMHVRGPNANPNMTTPNKAPIKPRRPRLPTRNRDGSVELPDGEVIVPGDDRAAPWSFLVAAIAKSPYSSSGDQEMTSLGAKRKSQAAPRHYGKKGVALGQGKQGGASHAMLALGTPNAQQPARDLVEGQSIQQATRAVENSAHAVVDLTFMSQEMVDAAGHEIPKDAQAVEELSQRPLSERLNLLRATLRRQETQEQFATQQPTRQTKSTHKLLDEEEDIPLSKRQKMLKNSVSMQDMHLHPDYTESLQQRPLSGYAVNKTTVASPLQRKDPNVGPEQSFDLLRVQSNDNSLASLKNKGGAPSGMQSEDFGSGFDPGFYDFGYCEDWQVCEDTKEGPCMQHVGSNKQGRPESSSHGHHESGGNCIGFGRARNNRFVIASQSPGSTQPYNSNAVGGVAQHASPLPSFAGGNSSIEIDEAFLASGAATPSHRRLNRLRKGVSGNFMQADRRNGPQPPKSNMAPTNGIPCKSRHAAAAFLDTEADISGSENMGSDDEDEDDGHDGYEAEFIDDGSQVQVPAAEIYAQYVPNAGFSPTPGELLQRLQKARLGRRAGLSNLGSDNQPAEEGLPLTADDYDLEDSFIDDENTDNSEASSDHNDDACGVCGGASGELLLCDGCPGAYHLACCALEAVPEGDWYCIHCK